GVKERGRDHRRAGDGAPRERKADIALDHLAEMKEAAAVGRERVVPTWIERGTGARVILVELSDDMLGRPIAERPPRDVIRAERATRRATTAGENAAGSDGAAGRIIPEAIVEMLRELWRRERIEIRDSARTRSSAWCAVSIAEDEPRHIDERSITEDGIRERDDGLFGLADERSIEAVRERLEWSNGRVRAAREEKRLRRARRGG